MNPTGFIIGFLMFAIVVIVAVVYFVKGVEDDMG